MGNLHSRGEGRGYRAGQKGREIESGEIESGEVGMKDGSHERVHDL